MIVSHDIYDNSTAVNQYSYIIWSNWYYQSKHPMRHNTRDISRVLC